MMLVAPGFGIGENIDGTSNDTSKGGSIPE
jgi:hypothetical protein